MKKHFIAALFSLLAYTGCPAQDNTMCSNMAARSWWDVREYELQLTFDTATNFITGSNTITALVTGQPLQALQLELHEPLHIDSVQLAGHHPGIYRQGDIYFITGDFSTLKQQDSFALKVYYSGLPVIAKRAPWDGGIVHSRDAEGLPWLAVACQGAGAYLWFPCKNFEGDEPERAVMHYTVPANLSAIGNGRLIRTENSADKQLKTFTWAVQNPINNYDITFYIGDYVHWSDTFAGAKGKLSLDYYVLRANEERARKQFAVVKPMLECFEAKMGPYPFYEDGYKLVDAPYLGMEHQSAVAYGNEYKMGYLGRDRSKTGVGLTFDFIIIHESGHEWFGNNITAYDVADTWIHEGFTSYSETIFAECLRGKEESFRYQQGKRQLIRNDMPVQGKYNACDEGSGDHYDKGAFTVHMVRMVVNDDERFFAMLRDMNKKFYHQLVKSADIENFMSTYAGKDFSKLFSQYLRHIEIPALEWETTGKNTSYRWTNCVEGFDMPVLVTAPGKKESWIYPTTVWQKAKVKGPVKVNPNFLVDLK
jgi:aminopeptidase N